MGLNLLHEQEHPGLVLLLVQHEPVDGVFVGLALGQRVPVEHLPNHGQRGARRVRGAREPEAHQVPRVRVDVVRRHEQQARVVGVLQHRGARRLLVPRELGRGELLLEGHARSGSHRVESVGYSFGGAFACFLGGKRRSTVALLRITLDIRTAVYFDCRVAADYF